jgi:hypothetical protein
MSGNRPGRSAVYGENRVRMPTRRFCEDSAVRFRCKLFYLKRAIFTTFLIFYEKFVQFMMAQKTAVKNG